MANPVTDDARERRVYVVPLTFKTYASSTEEALADADAFATSHPVLERPGIPVPVGRPGDTTAADADLRMRLGALVLSHAPRGINGKRLLQALEKSTLGEVVGDVAAGIPGSEGQDEPAYTQDTTGKPAPTQTGGDVTFTLPDHEPTRLPATEAARLMVAAYGQRANDQDIGGLSEAFNAYWAEVDRLLEAQQRA
jgi:hypothetical protein